MKKFTNRLVFLLSLSFGCYLMGISQNLKVSGITNPSAANGIYEPNGSLYGYNSWKHATENFYIYNDDYAGRYWNIDDDTDDNVSGVLFHSSTTSTESSPVNVPVWLSYGTTTTPTPTGTPVIAELSLDPEMDVLGNSISIADGDNTPSTADHTEFGSLNVSSGSLSRTYTIENTGDADLTLTDASPYVSISGHTSDFTLTTIPSSTISASGSTTFQIYFNPTTTGTRSATISIANDDSDENPYNFAMQGEGYSAPSATTGSATSITVTSTTLNGTVNANNTSTTVTFEYGLTDSYGTSVTADESPVSGTTGVSVSYDLTGLSPYTTYHYRVIGSSSAGTTNGADQTFTTLAQAATVTTQAVTDITMTTATGNGNITDLGDPNPTQYGVCWSISENPTTANDHTEEGAVAATGAFTSNITGLNPNTTYYVRAYATNAAGTTYGTQVSFTTNPEPAIVTTQAVTDITMTTATGNGNITDLGVPNPTQHGVCWSISENPTTADANTDEGAVAATGAFTSSFTGLNPNTTYYVRSYATNTAGTSYGAQVSFTTDPEPNTVTTQAVTDITMTTASGNGNITDLGDPNPTQHGVCWSISENPTTANDHTEEGAVAATGAFTSSITGLNPNTTYYVRAYATNPAGTTYGTQVSFTTDPGPSIITTQAVTDITMTTATGNGNITDLGSPNPIQHGICWSTSENPTTADANTDEGAVAATGAFTSSFTGLNPNTTYYVRAYATNTAGTSYGAQVSFTTDPEPNTVTTQAVTDITMTTASGNGNITDLGDPNPTQHGVCWSKSENPTTADNNTEEGAVAATGAFTSSITGLNPNTTYYVRAYATNAAGTSYGAQVNFTTLAEAPSVTTNAIAEMTTTSATLVGIVNANNASTTVTFEYGLTDSYGTTVAADESPVSGTSDTPVSSKITGLSPNTTYHYRVVGVNIGGTSNGADMTFTTTMEPSVVTTQDVSGIGISRATGNGNITDLGMPNPTAHGVCWNTEGSPTIADEYSDEGAASSTGAFTSEMPSLNANTSYFVKAYATNIAGTVYGEEVSFSTLPNPPVVTTKSATEVNTFSVVLNGTVDPNDANTTVTFEYGLDNSYGTTITADQSPVSGDSEVEVSYEVTGLASNTTYHFRVIAVNDGGTNYGNDSTFTTLSQAPVAITNAVTDIEATTAILNGTINANDLSTTATFEYGLTTNYSNNATADQSPVTGTTDTDVNVALSGLSPNTIYFYRLVGRNTESTTNGEDQTFTTAKYDQDITFNALPDKTIDDMDFDPEATSSLGLEISYSSSNELVATLVDGQIHIVGVGTTNITANQEGNDTVNAAISVTQNLTVNAITGIDEFQLSKLKVYPNPAGKILFIEKENLSLTENVSVVIIDMTGKIVLDKKFDNLIQSVDVSNLKSGLYFIKVKTSEITKSQVFIKE